MATSRSVFAQFNAADGRLRDPAFQSATSMGTPTVLPQVQETTSPFMGTSGIDKEAANRASAQAFQDAVRAANPGLNFADRDPFRMSMDRDVYDQAEDYYRQYGTGLPQFQQPATQTRALDPQNKDPNSAASQLAAFSAASNSPTGSMLGSAGTLPVPPAVQPFLQNTPQMLGGFGQMPNLSQMLGGPQPSVPTAPTSSGGSAFGQAGGAFPSTPGNYGGGASGGMALEGRYGIASGNSTPFPIQGNVSVVKLAQGGDVSKARQMLQSLTSPVQRFADGGQVVPPGYRVSLVTGELVPVNATVAQLTEIFKGGEAQQANAAAAAQAVAASTAPAVSAPPVQASPVVSAPVASPAVSAPPTPTPTPVQDIISSYSSYSPPSEPVVSAPPTPVQASPAVSAPVASPPSSNLSEGLQYVQQHPEIFGSGQAGVDKYYQNIRDYVTGTNRSAAEVLADMSKYGVTDKDIRDALAGTQSSNLSEGLQFVQQHPEIFGSGQAGVDKYYQNIRDFVDTKGADLSAAQVLAEMDKYGVSDKDIRDALAGTDYSAGAVHALLNPDIGAKGSPGYGVGGLSGMSANIRAKVDDLTQQAQKGMLSQGQAVDFFTTQLSPTGGFNEADIIRATGKTSAELLAQMRPVILPPTTPLPDVPAFVPPTAPAPVAPPVALTPGQSGLDVGTAIGGKIPQEERVATPQLETAFRSSSPRDPIYDRFGRITGYNYSSAAKLTPATGTDVFNFVPPGVISRPRSLIEVGKVPGITFDPVTGQMRLPLSASQQFARDRSEIDNKLRAYLQTSAAADSALPSQPPSAASIAFRNYVLSDPQLSTQLRMRNIAQTPLQQQEYMPGGGESPNMQAIRQARSEFGETPYASAMEQGLQTFLNRNRQAFLNSKLMQKSYFERYPDIAAEYQKNWSKSMGPEEYALYHYRTLGEKEGRLPPNFVAQPFFSKGGEASTEDFIKKQSGGDVSRETASPETRGATSVDEREEVRSEVQRMLKRAETLKSSRQEEEKSLGEKTIEAGLRLYDRFSDRAKMPVNQRVFLETVLDKSKEPITEASFSKKELDTLKSIILDRYKKIEPALDSYEKYLTEKLAGSNTKKRGTGFDKGVLYPEARKTYEKDLDAIRSYRQGTLTPEFVELADTTQNLRSRKMPYYRHYAFEDISVSGPDLFDKLNVSPVIGYDDYGIDAGKARRLFAGDDPRAALHTTLGRFRYKVDPETKGLVVVDRYDFNPPTAGHGGPSLPYRAAPGFLQVVTYPVEGAEPGGSSVGYDLVRTYAGRAAPEGSGRDVRIQLDNKQAPVPYNKGGEVNVPRETSTSKQQLDKLAQVSKRKKA